MSDSRRKAGKAKGARRGGRPPVDALTKGKFIKALSKGASHEAAARKAGFSRSAFYRVRKRDSEFAAMWEEAIQRSLGPRFVSGGAKRKLQLRRNRRVRFTEEKRETFLAHFEGSCNLTDAADEAGVADSTVWSMRARNPEFARRFQQALDQGYVRLEVEAVRQRLEAQRKMREDILPTGEISQEFERVMKLLQRWDRHNGRAGPRAPGRGHETRWTFEESLALLEKKLRNMGVPIEPLPSGYERPDLLVPLPPPDPERRGEEGDEEGEDGR